MGVIKFLCELKCKKCGKLWEKIICSKLDRREICIWQRYKKKSLYISSQSTKLTWVFRKGIDGGGGGVGKDGDNGDEGKGGGVLVVDGGGVAAGGGVSGGDGD